MSRWSLAEQREFLKIAVSAKSLEEIVDRTGRTQKGILHMAVKLGVAMPADRSAATKKTKPRGSELKRRSQKLGKS